MKEGETTPCVRVCVKQLWMAGLSQPPSSKVKFKREELGKKNPQARGIAGMKCLSKNCTFCRFVSVLLCPLFQLNWELLIIAIRSTGITAWDGSTVFSLGL